VSVRAALPHARAARRAVRLPQGHGACPDRGESPQQPGAGSVFRIGVAARLGAVTDRRSFLGAGAALLLAGCGGRGDPPLPAGRLFTTNHALGHRLRDGTIAAAKEKRRAKVVIVGAGISGLSAAWRLRRAGMGDFTLLELESR